jgi:hypothetical protein
MLTFLDFIIIYPHIGHKVRVSISPEHVALSTCMISLEGIWTCALGPVNASLNTYTITATSGIQRIVLRDVLFGDVWVRWCSCCGCKAWYCNRGLTLFISLVELLQLSLAIDGGGGGNS